MLETIQVSAAFMLSCFMVATGYGFGGYWILKVVLYMVFGIKINVDIKLSFDRK